MKIPYLSLCFITTLSALNITACSSNSNVKPTQTETKEKPSLEEEVKKFKRDLPITDPSGELTITSAYIEGDNHVKMEAHYNNISIADIDISQIKNNESFLKKQMTKDACSGSGKELLDLGVDFTIALFDKNDSFIIEQRVNQGDCS